MTNQIPDNPRHIHLTAICGTAMGALACMLREAGFHVTGSDRNVYPPMSTFLEAKKITVFDGFQADNLSPQPDLVVIGNAVSKDNPEVQAVMARGIAFCSMPQAIHHFFCKNKKMLVVAGTHGKTTTASMLAWVLTHAGFDPSFVIGGIHKNFDSNYRLGSGDYIVIEGDEYDTAFFDKEAKFFHYPPYISIITSVEYDHADIFDDLTRILDTFRKFIAMHSPKSRIIYNGHDENLKDLVAAGRCFLEQYGSAGIPDWSYVSKGTASLRNRFDVFSGGSLVGRFSIPMPGEHNLQNALAVIALTHRLGIETQQIRSALESFEGIRRRQEIRGMEKGIIVMDDFAHHPTAVNETIRGVKGFYPEGRIIAVFEPRTNSSMRDVFQDAYADAFSHADLVCIRKIPVPEKIPADRRFSSQQLVDDLNAKQIAAFFFNNADEIIAFLSKNAVKGDVILVMSNGGFENIHERLLAQLKSVA